jgi:hypothetical protein
MGTRRASLRSADILVEAKRALNELAPRFSDLFIFVDCLPFSTWVTSDGRYPQGPRADIPSQGCDKFLQLKSNSGGVFSHLDLQTWHPLRK